ncbi:metal resistance protein Ycf1p [[Candida] anglica]|uniref:Metal resistance protein Ycf1p n=1 Tax=[Candida] anglica TaxID=148631 RepID=A0ABP0EA59_9ASCO
MMEDLFMDMARGAAGHLDFLWSDYHLQSSAMDRSVDVQFATLSSNNTIDHHQHHARFLSCSTRGEGWGPVSPVYSDFTPCFVAALYLFSAVLTIGAGAHQISILRQRKASGGNRVGPIFYSKLALVILQFVVLSIAGTGSSSSLDIINVSALANLVAVMVALGLHYIEQFKTVIPNGVLLFYWLFQVILGLVKFVNLKLRIDSSSSSSHHALALIGLATANALIILLVECYFPPRPINKLPSKSKVSPYDTANIFSRITFHWMASLMKKGYIQFLTEEDLPTLPSELKSKATTAQFSHYWDKQLAQSTSSPSLFWAICQAFGLPFMVGGFFKFVQDILAFAQPQLLRMLIRFVNDYSESKKTGGEPLPLTRGVMIAVSMFVVSVTQTAALHQYFQRGFDLGMKIKSALTARIYSKSLVLSNEAKSQSNTGDIVNLMSVDTQRLQDLAQNLQIIWSGPLQIILCLVSLHGILGNSMWAGVTIMLIMIPLNAAIAKYQKKLQKTQMKNKDERSRLISEILNNIKSLKLYGWEQPYLARLNHVRNEKELKNLKRMGIFSAISNFSWNFAPFLVSCSTFAVFVLIEKDRMLSTDIVFPALSLFNLLSFPLAVVPMVITNIVESQVAVTRLTKFLTGTELQKDAVIRNGKSGSVGAVSIKNGTFLWTKTNGEENYKVALSQINLDVKTGKLDCIVGKVGSGKSSIIQAILGDLYRLEGEVKVDGSVAYVSQVPWIMNGTVKENILFGHKYDPEFYATVLKACALSVDLKILPRGDKTEVGEKGISLSGGQKARLSLARAVYARADVYLLDDPLSAVDEHVGRHLIDNVLGPEGLLKSKCKILATNAISVLSIADSIHMVSDGRLVEQGTYSAIMKKEKSQLKSLIEEYGRKAKETPEKNSDDQEEKNSDAEEEELEDLDEEELAIIQNARVDLRRASLAPLEDDGADSDSQSDSEADIEAANAKKEHMEQGKVKWDVYLQYAKACNPSRVCWYLGCTIFTMLTSVCSNIWLKHWSEVNTEKGYNPNIALYLGIYFGLGLLSSSLSLAQNCIMWIFCTIHGSKRLHNNMAVSVLRAPMSFFETTPIGRILNRFSNDVYKIDEILGRVFGMFFSNSIKVMFTIVVICFSTWQFTFMLAPIAILYVYYQQYYMKTSRELRRLDSVSRSPIFANFQESLNGVSIIRAYGQQERFQYLNESRIDRNMSAYHPSINANRWLAVRLEFLGSLIILGAAGLSIMTLSSGRLSAGLVGLSVSYALQITQSLNWIVRMTVEVETNIVSVERILEYSRLTPEAPEIIEDNRPAASWPEAGAIQFKNYSTKYRPELDLVLKNININIRPHEKVGIVGRTGAGKSSLTLALFRIIESCGGHIDVDNVDTSKIGLADLRHKLSIIPQDSQVFEGSIRSNLDPTDRSTDEQIWRALELSHLKDHVLKMYEEADNKDELKSKLEVGLSEGGSNLSVGQRQLMCLARSLLIPSHILVLDEATAAVDVETDRVLQETIRKEFKDRTILTIAHRLNTILDSDRIIVLDQGQVAEFDTPANLLKKKESLFYGLCKEGGFVHDD